jgi:hypothetical protein
MFGSIHCELRVEEWMLGYTLGYRLKPLMSKQIILQTFNAAYVAEQETYVWRSRGRAGKPLSHRVFFSSLR